MNEETDSNTAEPADKSVLTVRVASPDEVFDQLEDRFAALDDGERPEPTYEVVLQREADINRLLRSNNLQLLRTIAREAPASIRETARLVDRDVRQVHDALSELKRMNLIRFETDGRAKRPVVWYDAIDVEVPITGEPSTTAPA